jgi:Transglycosylase SLT domain
MALPPIPARIAQYIKEAATGTHLPESVVAAQNYTESGYGQNMGPSSAGALGPWQFLPSTYAGTGEPAGTENDWAYSTQAYIKYMNQLLKEEHGNVRNALAAYNAGPGNLQAGYGYADHILSLAGQGNITVGTTSPQSSSSLIPGLGGITGPLGTIANVFSTIDTVLKDILSPSFWLRIASFFAGILLLVAGIWCLVRASDNSPIIPQAMPVPVPI